ncbi:MAG: tyrosine-type recombinase/integrase, partial [Methanotrichaceae archaeon]|nr:tyrosine-type recombinase/integrase [Methanotrichaceae archaeon]
LESDAYKARYNWYAADLINRFHEDCKLCGFVSDMGYVYRTREFCAFLESSGKTPMNASKEDIKAFLARLKEKGNRVGTIGRIFTCLSAFYDFLIEEDLAENNIIGPSRKRYLRKYKNDTDSEIRKLISIEDASRLVNSILDPRDRSILVLLFKTGLRVGELVSLDVDDVDLAKGEITLKRTKKRSNRLLYLDNEAATVLSKWLVSRKNRHGSKGPALFISKTGKRMSKITVETMTKKHSTRIGLHDPTSLKLEDRFTPHCCRHWFVTHLLSSGMPRDFVKELRGDARREAIDIYNHIDKKELQESYLAHIPQLGI